MKHVKKSVLLWYTPAEMYELVTQVEHYPDFLPWCERTEVLERHDDGMTVKLHLAYAGLRHAFTTRNTHVPGEAVVLQLVDGPFRTLEGDWRFQPLGKAGEPPRACKVELDLQYALARGPLETMLTPVFDRVAGTMVDRFVARAEQVYGER